MKVNVWDLPQDKVWVGLERDFQRELINKARGICKTLKNLAEITGVSISSVYPQHVRDRPKSLKFFMKLLEFLRKNDINYDIQQIERKIVEIRAGWQGVPIKNPKIPFNFDSRYGGTVLSAFYFDGSIRSTGKNYARPAYNNQEEVMINNFKEACREVFGNIEFNEDNSGNVNLAKIVGYVLISGFNYIPGRKSINNPQMSELILNNKNEEFLYSFLKQAFSDEGTISSSEVKLRNVVDVTKISEEVRCKIKEDYLKNNNFAPNLLKGLVYLLEKINIRVNGPRFDKEYEYVDKHEKKHIVFSWEINIAGKRNLELFRKKVGFFQISKIKKLDELIFGIKNYHLPKSRGLQIVCKNVLELIRGDKRISSQTVCTKLNKGPHMTNIWLRKLVKMGYLKRVSGKGCRFYPYLYEPTKKLFRDRTS